MKLSRKLSEQALKITEPDQVKEWLRAVDKEIGGLTWAPLGGIPNNVHTVQVSADSALALVERPINSIDAVLDLRAVERGETAPTPHDAAKKWWGVPAGGLSELKPDELTALASLIRVTNLESGEIERPTIVIQDSGIGQHPDDFPKTLLSLLESNKKSKTHQMGVYNAGGAASYAFCPYTFIISRRAPQVLGGKADEVGITVVRYDPLDPDKYKSGTYVYCVAKGGAILRADLPGLPDAHAGVHAPDYGTYVKHISYELSRYHRAAFEPKKSFWHLFHAAVPDPPLPYMIVETRRKRFPGMSADIERRSVRGLLHLLRREGRTEYSDERPINLGAEDGTVALRYFVLKDGTDPDAYTTSEQGLTMTLNGQRQGTKDRYWVKRNTDFHYIFKRLVVLVDGNGLTNTAKREVFASTRESHKESPLARKILELVISDLQEDEHLQAVDEAARQRTISDATRSTSEKVKKQLANQVAAFLKGQSSGEKGGKPKPKPTKKTVTTHKPPKTDDSAMLDIPDKLEIISDPLWIEPDGRAGLRLGINAKNGFLPKYEQALKIVFGPEIKDHVKIVSTGRLLGGRVRITVAAADDTPLGKSILQVALVEPSLGVLLHAQGTIEVIKAEPAEEEPEDKAGGQPDVEILWHERAKWGDMEPVWDEETVGKCVVKRAEGDPTTIVRVEWHLNKAFAPYEKIIDAKKLGEAATKTFQEAYEYPICWGMFKQSIAEYEKEKEKDADDENQHVEIPDDYVKGELARLARAVLIAKEPEVAAAEAIEG